MLQVGYVMEFDNCRWCGPTEVSRFIGRPQCMRCARDI